MEDSEIIIEITNYLVARLPKYITPYNMKMCSKTNSEILLTVQVRWSPWSVKCAKLVFSFSSAYCVSGERGSFSVLKTQKFLSKVQNFFSLLPICFHCFSLDCLQLLSLFQNTFHCCCLLVFRCWLSVKNFFPEFHGQHFLLLDSNVMAPFFYLFLICAGFGCHKTLPLWGSMVMAPFMLYLYVSDSL